MTQRNVTVSSMTEKQFVITVLKCSRCDGEWVPRRPEVPRRCPKCGSPYWDRPRRRKAA